MAATQTGTWQKHGSHTGHYGQADLLPFHRPDASSPCWRSTHFAHTDSRRNFCPSACPPASTCVPHHHHQARRSTRPALLRWGDSCPRSTAQLPTLSTPTRAAPPAMRMGMTHSPCCRGTPSVKPLSHSYLQQRQVLQRQVTAWQVVRMVGCAPPTFNVAFTILLRLDVWGTPTGHNPAPLDNTWMAPLIAPSLCRCCCRR